MNLAFKTSLLLSALTGSLAASESASWSKPCFNGECTAETALYSMTVHGPKEVISDISEAADWLVIGCDPKEPKQDIRIVCKKDETSSGCSDLLQGDPVNRLVRVPPDCTDEGFVRVSKFGIASNQDIPPGVAEQLGPKASPKVHALSFDVDYSKIPKPSAPVKFSFSSATNKKNSPQDGASKRDPLEPRYWIGQPPRFPLNSDVENPTIDAEKVDDTVEFHVAIQNKTGEMTLLEPFFDCGLGKASVTAALKVTASADVDLDLSAGILAVGTIIPPAVSEFRMYGKLDGHVSGSIKIAGSAQGTLDTDDVVLIDAPILVPGISSVIAIGPKLQLAVRLRGRLDMTLEQEIGFNYKINDMRMFFPESPTDSKKQNSGTVDPVETPVSLKLGKTATTTLNVTAHIMPRLAIGITVPAGRADLFAEIDISGCAGVSFTRTKSKRAMDRFAAVAARTAGIDSGLVRREATLAEQLEKEGMEGCAYALFSVGANIGASASFFQIFNSDPDYKYKLFDPLTWELFKVCTSDENAAALQVEQPETPHLSDEYTKLAAIENMKTGGGTGLDHRRSLPRRSALERRKSTMKCTKDFQPGNLVAILQGAVQAKKFYKGKQ
ncbi:hypothetical protein HGRIS_006446 [Hohenbuehelia grisea]|uniref:Uncharacterized protein n=1 Tax=Hohenbuehelia grisea TaxID=104357 RepID=A0ABR3JZX1_9AGAR